MKIVRAFQNLSVCADNKTEKKRFFFSNLGGPQYDKNRGYIYLSRIPTSNYKIMILDLSRILTSNSKVMILEF